MSLGYKIGKKIRLTEVTHDTNLLWQIGVREIHVLLRHYITGDALRQAFEEIKESKGNKPPSKTAMERCAPFKDILASDEDWSTLTKYCQHSFINILESGVILNNGSTNQGGVMLLLDFNTESVRFYAHGKETVATFAEILEFAEMPTKTYTEIITEMRERFAVYREQIGKVDEEIRKIQLIMEKAFHEQNILQKARALQDDMLWERKKLDMGYRFFYHRLEALDLIDHSE